MDQYSLGLDYGTNSCRCVIVDISSGREIASDVYDFPRGESGILLDAKDPNVARQHPQDYIDGTVAVVTNAIEKAIETDRAFDAANIIGIGIDTTGSTPIPVDRDGTPLGLLSAFQDNLNAMAWLWKDHTSHEEAARITEVAAALRPQYLARCGGTYSSEWFWAKLWHCLNVAPHVFSTAYSFVEHCDYMPALLAGNTESDKLVRGVCAAGHKAMYCEEWGGLPDSEFLNELDPALADLRGRLYDRALTADQPAGTLCDEWARKLGMKPGIAIAVGAFDAHMGAIGSCIADGTLVKILGTSTCDLLVKPSNIKLPDIAGVCGIVEGSVLPGHFGIEAGQSAVGDIFLWFVNHLVPESYGKTQAEKFANLADAAEAQKPGEHGLLALDWNNGNRCVLVDARLSGMILGQTLHTEAHEIYRALVEATAFGALTIIDRIEEYGVEVNEVVTCGGLAGKNSMLMQIYADVTNRPMKIARSDQTCAVGAAICGAVAAGKDGGGFESIQEAQQAMCGIRDEVYEPCAQNHAVYAQLHALYRELHDAFGTGDWSGTLDHVMKKLIAIREEQRQ